MKTIDNITVTNVRGAKTKYKIKQQDYLLFQISFGLGFYKITEKINTLNTTI